MYGRLAGGVIEYLAGLVRSLGSQRATDGTLRLNDLADRKEDAKHFFLLVTRSGSGYEKWVAGYL